MKTWGESRSEGGGSPRGRVLVTGADGFIGSHLVERLRNDGYSVRALCVYNANGSLGWLDSMADRDGIEAVLGDIRDSGLVRKVCAGVDVIFHLAALISIPYSYEAPRAYVDTNVLGTMNVLDAALAQGVRRVVHTSTSEVYGTPETVPIRESHPLKGQSPYSASKIAADKMAESYARSFDCPVVILRPFNTFGPRQSLRAVIGTILWQLMAGVRELHLGSLAPRRDFTFVSDTVEGFMRMAVADIEPGEIIHLGTGRAVSIRELVERCMVITGSSAEIVTKDDRLRPIRSEVMELLSDPALALSKLGWQPTIGLDDGLRVTAEWISSLPGLADPHRYVR